VRYQLLFIQLILLGAVHAQSQLSPHKSTINLGNTLPHVVITDFKIFNQYLPVDSLLKLRQIELPNDRNSFSISFALAGLTQADTLVYSYKLDGAEKDWMQTPKPITVNYTLLPPAVIHFEYIEEAQSGGAPMTSSIATQVLKMFAQIQHPATEEYNLSEREKAVLQLLVNGYSYKMISAELFIAIDTVRSHIKKFTKSCM